MLLAFPEPKRLVKELSEWSEPLDTVVLATGGKLNG